MTYVERTILRYFNDVQDNFLESLDYNNIAT